ncbi:hypothetical protein [Pseudoalteromonas rubra]|uniref:Lipoprotein n=1 Tax=Pseudoalteromonas rubra TaxID=43658 RepID=A0A5S3X2I2_9GAMM|nr:hypothetical protein [Pseudoalteromonas rubra]TMP38587.1 hypothetical protein CWB98_05335 [Pseudoalteromonas rubra]
MKKIFGAVLILGLSGCASTHVQKGVDVTKESSFAVIKTETEKEHTLLTGLDQRVVIKSLNGEMLALPGNISPAPDVLNVNKGVHTIEVQYRHKNTFANGCVWVDAKAGSSYLIRRKVVDYAVTFWIENTDTNEVVGGICGTEPK